MAGERIVLLMDVNGHPLHNKLHNRFKAEQTEMEEFSHKCWGPKEPYMHTRGKYPIDGAYKTPEVEIVNLACSPLQRAQATTDLYYLISQPALCLENTNTRYVAQ
jgi:hypothetical protein